MKTFERRDVFVCCWWLRAVVVPVLVPGGVLAGVLAGVQVSGFLQVALGGVVPVLFPCQ